MGEHCSRGEGDAAAAWLRKILLLQRKRLGALRALIGGME
jgi:hypothetical protein